jgi:KaiC/GvpD/RAD55 family RecA-like ATPase
MGPFWGSSALNVGEQVSAESADREWCGFAAARLADGTLSTARRERTGCGSSFLLVVMMRSTVAGLNVVRPRLRLRALHVDPDAVRARSSTMKERRTMLLWTRA